MIISLKGARNNAGYTQREIADKLGISISTVSKLEKDSSNISKCLLDNMTELYRIDQDNVFLGKHVDYQKKYHKKRIESKSK